MVSLGRKSAVAEPDAAHAEPVQVIGAHTSAPQAAFPRVNLIPAQIAQEARVGRAKQIVVVSVVASIAAVGSGKAAIALWVRLFT